MKLSLLLPPTFDESKLTLDKQTGVRFVITKAAPELSVLPVPHEYDALRTVKENFSEARFSLLGLEGDQLDMSRIKLGLLGHDEDIEGYHRILHNDAA